MTVPKSALFASHRGLLSLIVFCLILYWLSKHVPLIQDVDWALQDQFIQLKAKQREASTEILVIDIDDSSLVGLGGVLGKWPWPRSVHAEILEYLQAQSPKAVVFDILFTEPDIYRPDSDAYFSEVLSKNSNNFLAIATQPTFYRDQAPLLISYDKSIGLKQTSRAQNNARALILLPTLTQSASESSLMQSQLESAHPYQLGSINLTPDADGVTRRYYVNQSIEGWQLLSLPASVAKYMGVSLPSSESIILDWYGNNTTPHQKLSYAEVLAQVREGKNIVPPDFFKDKIIIIGTTALGLHDLRKTPLSDFYPGVFILSTALNNLLAEESISLVSTVLIDVVTITLLIVLGFGFMAELNLLTVLCSVLMLTLAALVSWLSALNGKLVLIVPSSISILTLLLGSLFLIHQQHQAKLKKTIQLFSRFMDPAIVHQLIEKQHPEDLLSTKNVQVTMLFSDIRNFTSISEQRTAGEMVSLLNHYFDRQVQTLFKHKATLDKFIGDAVMAFWGAPLEHAQHPIYAINAALEMIDNLDEFIEEYGYKDFDIGIGIHTGQAVVGLVGSHERYDYTAIGDTVNLASRIEGLTKGRSRILVSEATKRIAEEHFDFVPQGEFKVKGRSQPVKLYEPTRKMEVKYD